MAPLLARLKLARAARRLNEEARATLLPALLLMTDDARLADPIAAALALPKGAGIILRRRDPDRRAKLGLALAGIARRRQLTLLVSEDESLAMRIGAAGLHFPERLTERAARLRARHPDWLVTIAAHSERAVMRARAAGANAALLAPVFSTKSHPGRPALGASRFRLMAFRATLPVYALGGVTAANAVSLVGAPLAGIAGIDALVSDYNA